MFIHFVFPPQHLFITVSSHQNQKIRETHFASTKMTDANAPINAEDRKIGPIPLPWFIPMCIFVPSFLAMFVYFIYLHTVKKYKNKKQMKAQDEEAAGGKAKDTVVDKGVEKQVRSFIDVPVGEK